MMTEPYPRSWSPAFKDHVLNGQMRRARRAAHQRSEDAYSKRRLGDPRRLRDAETLSEWHVRLDEDDRLKAAAASVKSWQDRAAAAQRPTAEPGHDWGTALTIVGIIAAFLALVVAFAPNP